MAIDLVPAVSCSWCGASTPLERTFASVRGKGQQDGYSERTVYALPDQWREASASGLSRQRFACSQTCAARVTAIFVLLPEDPVGAVGATLSSCSFEKFRDAVRVALGEVSAPRG